MSITTLTWLASEDRFITIIEKLMQESELSDSETSYILACAILLIKSYEKDKRRTTHFELGYFIIMSYSTLTKDFSPLLDISTSFGFYPISKFIIDKGLIKTDNISNFIMERKLETFNYKGITETFEQQKFRKELIESNQMESSYVAPTSFGKSSLFIDVIKTINPQKVAIVVPTKSLLTQTYRNINRNFPEKKIIFHDEMYDGEVQFIAVFTQERALRLMKNPEVFFDMLIIDEAHNIFEYSSRSILLTRLIRRNRQRNPMAKVYYFSPLISDSKNLKLEENQMIDEKIISFNIKEPRLFECKADGRSYIYNRFVDEFFEVPNQDDYVSYILNNSELNNFIYLRAPRKVEEFAKLLSQYIEVELSDELNELSKTISKNVHEDFYAVDLVKKGIIYLHGKLPDLVKEYLEYKFRETPALNFIVANKVILEGVNLPIDNLYVLNTYGLQSKDLINLIGRVNRLNEVFHKTDGNLSKLLPPIHFVNSEFAGAKANMRNKMRLLKSGILKDEVKNPILLNFDFDRIENKIENSTNAEEQRKATDAMEKAIKLRQKEDFLIFDSHDENHKIMAAFMESNLDTAYTNTELLMEELITRVKLLVEEENWYTFDILDKVYEVFIKDLEEFIRDQTFARLRNQQARNFYRVFVKNSHILTLKEHINETVRYFYTISGKESGKRFYIGPSYGEMTRDESSQQQSYIDLSTKGHKELVNLALVKIKIESDFVSYKLNEYVALLKEMNLIDEDEYNEFIYGTTKKLNTEFTKLGFSGTLISKLERDGQLANISVNKLGHVTTNEQFKLYMVKQDDLVQFEVNKYIDVSA